MQWEADSANDNDLSIVYSSTKKKKRINLVNALVFQFLEMLRRVVWWKFVDVWGVLTASFIKAMIAEAARTSGTPVHYETTRRNIPEDGGLHPRHRENLKSHRVVNFLRSVLSCFSIRPFNAFYLIKQCSDYLICQHVSSERIRKRLAPNRKQSSRVFCRYLFIRWKCKNSIKRDTGNKAGAVKGASIRMCTKKCFSVIYNPSVCSFVLPAW
jgi:hypothetical protein